MKRGAAGEPGPSGPRRRSTGALVLAVVVLPLVACSGEGRAAAGRAGPVTHTVEIRDMAFRPAHLRIRPGDTIEWINRDLVAHTATAPDSAWTSPPLTRGERWRRVARSPGTLEYLCAFHPVMEARLIVEPDPPTEDTP